MLLLLTFTLLFIRPLELFPLVIESLNPLKTYFLHSLESTVQGVWLALESTCEITWYLSFPVCSSPLSTQSSRFTAHPYGHKRQDFLFHGLITFHYRDKNLYAGGCWAHSHPQRCAIQQVQWGGCGPEFWKDLKLGPRHSLPKAKVTLRPSNCWKTLAFWSAHAQFTPRFGLRRLLPCVAFGARARPPCIRQGPPKLGL